MDDAEIREATSAREVDALVALFNELETSSVTADRVKQMRIAMRRRDVLAWIDGQAVGFGLVGLFPGMEETPEAAARFAVLPEFRCRGIGGKLHAELFRYARAVGRDALEVQVSSSDERSLGWLGRRGYRETERLFSLRLDLAGSALPAVSLPPEIRLVSFAEQPERAVALFDLVRETIADVPGTFGEQIPVEFESWAALELDPHSRPPELAILALDGDALAGAGWVKRDGETVWHSYTGVRRPWRGRGIARAIKLAQLHAARASGCRYSLTDNHVDNAPIAKLNRELGYEPYDVKITLVGIGSA